MDLNKHLSFFNPIELKKEEIHIIGCGAIGSNVALQLAKLGIEKLYLWDFDTVDEHNITNQVYDYDDIKMLKIDALEKHLLKQNPEIKVIKNKKYTNQPLRGVIIVCVDSINIRNKIANFNLFNLSIKMLIDGRIGLETGQVYCVDWSKQDNIENYIKTTEFDDKDVSVPVSACGTTLSVSPSVMVTASYIVSYLINYAKKVSNPSMILLDAFNFKTVSYI